MDLKAIRARNEQRKRDEAIDCRYHGSAVTHEDDGLDCFAEAIQDIEALLAAIDPPRTQALCEESAASTIATDKMIEMWLLPPHEPYRCARQLDGAGCGECDAIFALDDRVIRALIARIERVEGRTFRKGT